MQFKNLSILQMGHYDLTLLEQELSKQQFEPCLGSAKRSEGFTPLTVNDRFTFAADSRALCNYVIETKSVPASALKTALDEACAKFAETHGFNPGKKAKKELREDVFDQLISAALPSRKVIPVVISPRNGRIYIDSASPSVVDAIIKTLLKCAKIPLNYLKTELNPGSEMLARLLEDPDDDSEHLIDFDLNSAAETVSRDERGTIVRYKNLSLTSSEVVQTLQAGTRDVTKLAVTWQDLISFVLSADLTLRGIKYLDSFKHEIKCEEGKDDFGSIFYLYMSKVDEMVSQLIDNLGGLAEEK